MNDSFKDHALNLFSTGFHIDGRKLDEYREISYETGISNQSAEGSARVKIGMTEVVVGIKMEIGEPFPDRLDEGGIIVNAELKPFSSWKYDSGPPGINAIELSRLVDRVIREGKYLDLKKLCIEEGKRVWIVFIDIYPINDAGNLFDASILASLLALRDAKFPHIKNDRIEYKNLSDESLPLSKKIPLSCTVFICEENIIIDPDSDEENFIHARLTIGITEDNVICALQKGGMTPLTAEEIDKMVDLAMKKTKELREIIK